MQTDGHQSSTPLRRRNSLAELPLTDRVTYVTEMKSAVLYGVFAGLALPLIPIAARRIGMSAEAITVMMTMQFIGALFGIFFGHLADTRAVMPFAVWPPLIGRALLGLLAFVQGPGMFLGVVSVFFLLSNLNGPAYSSIMRTNYSDAHRSRLMSNIRIMVVIVSAILSAVAGVLLSTDERIVRWLFLVGGFAGAASSAVFGRIKVRRGARAPMIGRAAPFLPSLRVVRKNVPFMVFMGILFLCAAPDKLAVPLEPIWLVDVLHVNYAEASYLLGSVVSVVSIGGYFLWARLLKRFNSLAVLSVVVLAYAGRYAALTLARTSGQLVPMSILSGITNAGWDLVPLFCMISLAEPSNFSLYVGVNTTLFGVRGMIGPSLGTLLYTTGALSLGNIFWLISGLLAFGAVVLFVFSRLVRKKEPTAVRAAT